MIFLIILTVIVAIFLMALAIPSELLEGLCQLLFCIIIIIVGLAISFAIVAGLYWVICWAFSLTFSWKIAIGIWVIVTILRNIFKSSR